MSDNVNHPHYYASSKIEVLSAIEEWNLNFHRGQVIKYVSRAGKKDPLKEIEDLQKAEFYIKREIERLTASKENRLPVRPNDMVFKPDMKLSDLIEVKFNDFRFEPIKKMDDTALFDKELGNLLTEPKPTITTQFAIGQKIAARLAEHLPYFPATVLGYDGKYVRVSDGANSYVLPEELLRPEVTKP